MNDAETISNLPNDIKDQNKIIDQPIVNMQENICDDSEGAINTMVNREPSATRKETIEILNVEVVTPQRDNNYTDAKINESFNNGNVENAEIIKNENELPRNVLQNPATNDTTLQNNAISANVQFTGLEEKEHTDMNTAENATKTPEVIVAATTGGLSLLAQYQSDDDSDSVVEVQIASSQDYRNQVVEIDSSDTDSDEGVQCLNELRKTIEKRIQFGDDDYGDDEENDGDNTNKKKTYTKLKVKGEMLLEDLPPIQDLQITVPENECIELGKIHSIVDQLVLVEVLPNSILLDLETVIFLEKGQKVLGEVFDVLGQVADPLYCVRFNSNNQIEEKQINVGDIVYVAPKTQYTQYMILSNLMKQKGSDASWENDMEPPPRFLDYSDDEKEQLARRQLRNKDRPTDNELSNKKPRNLDDDDCTVTSPSISNAQHRNRYTEARKRVAPSAVNNNNRSSYGGLHQSQPRTQMHHRSSWHSNYYPHSFPSHPPNVYRMHPNENQPQASQPYEVRLPPYIMPPIYNMQYPSTQPPAYGGPPIFQQNGFQPMSNTFGNRPIRHSSFHTPQNHQHTSTKPPPDEVQ